MLIPGFIIRLRSHIQRISKAVIIQNLSCAGYRDRLTSNEFMMSWAVYNRCVLVSYLAARHVRHRSVGLDGLQLVQAPVQLLQRLQRHPQEVLIWKQWRRHLHPPSSILSTAATNQQTCKGCLTMFWLLKNLRHYYKWPNKQFMIFLDKQPKWQWQAEATCC